MTAASSWTIETKYGNYASLIERRPVLTQIEVEVDDTNVRVDCTVGSGYMRESTSADVPVDVLIQLLAGAGYEVRRTTQATGTKGGNIP